MLDDTAGQMSEGQRGVTLVLRNSGATPARSTYVYLELGDGWRLSDVLTTLGLVSVVDHTAVVRVGRLDPGALVAITLRGWPSGDEAPTFCGTLVTDGQARERQCSGLAAGE